MSNDVAGPGWFADPVLESDHQERWWNGCEWTRHVVPKERTYGEQVAYTGEWLNPRAPGVSDSLLAENRRIATELINSGGAIDGVADPRTELHVGGLMLRSYNLEVELLSRDLVPDRLNRTLHALEVARRSINDLGAPFGMNIAPEYHKVRVDELELVAQREGFE